MSKRLVLAIGLLLGLSIASCQGQEPCDQETCGGCCDARGVCQTGAEVSACGRGAAACADCGAGRCTRQVCVAAADAGRTSDGGLVGPADGGCVVGLCGAELCNTSSGQCEPGGSCDVGSPQPAGCGSGHLCVSGTCRDVPRPACMNFAATAAPLRWNPAVQFGPVITAGRAVSFAVDATVCPAGATRRSVTELEAYDFNTRFADGGFPRLFVYREGQTLGTISSGVTVTPSAQGANATLLISQCGPEAVTTLTLGYAFENGNGVCVRFPP
ncbi:MAG: hypothetical protein IAE78_10725 [Myxococcus sp.]|nr:hypothetical protein [Myxococcus sp.]